LGALLKVICDRAKGGNNLHFARMNDPQNEVPRTAFTLEETAALFGKHRSWAYRQVYAKRMKVITGYGAMLVPKSEVERILNSARQIK
jgi:hypothetical protein